MVETTMLVVVGEFSSRQEQALETRAASLVVPS